ncbi:MAG: hypothetical protein ACRBCI_14595 [Cellvibrionaceae bacterium]
MYKYTILVLSIVFSSYASSSSVGGAKITRIHLNANGFAYIKLDKTRTSSCTGGGANEFFVIDLSTRLGELQYTHALSIFHAQNIVTIHGTNQCASPHIIETISDFQLYR